MSMTSEEFISNNAALQRSLGRLEGKVDLLLSNMNSHLLEDTARFKVQSDRMDQLENRHISTEKKFAWLAGALAVIYFITNFATSLFPFLKHP